MANASVIPDVAVSKHCIINTGAMVNHGCILDDYTHPTKRGAFRERNPRWRQTRGVSVSVIPGIKIGKWVTVGAGAVIIRDIPDYATVVRNPRKIIKMGSGN